MVRMDVRDVARGIDAFLKGDVDAWLGAWFRAYAYGDAGLWREALAVHWGYLLAKAPLVLPFHVEDLVEGLKWAARRAIVYRVFAGEAEVQDPEAEAAIGRWALLPSTPPPIRPGHLEVPEDLGTGALHFSWKALGSNLIVDNVIRLVDNRIWADDDFYEVAFCQNGLEVGV